MLLLLLGLGLLLAGGIGAVFAGRTPERATRLGVAGAVAGSAAGLVPALGSFVTGSSTALRLPWAVPGGSFHVEIDPLSALFLLPIFVVAPLAAIYGGSYLSSTWASWRWASGSAVPPASAPCSTPSTTR